jgi:hypothetical protein
MSLDSIGGRCIKINQRPRKTARMSINLMPRVVRQQRSLAFDLLEQELQTCHSPIARGGFAAHHEYLQINGQAAP